MKINHRLHRLHRVLRFAALVVLLAGLLLVFHAGIVYAHAELVGAEPAPGAAMAGAPEEIRLTFSEPVTDGSRVTLLTADFLSIANIEKLWLRRRLLALFPFPVRNPLFLACFLR